MNTRIRTSSALIIVIAVTFVFNATSANAVIIGELGILDDTANGGINPATGAAWAPGDQYRLVFTTSGRTDATSSNIATYNSFVQGLANAAGLGTGWNAIASTATVDARDNTSTNPGVDGTGVGVFRIDGITKIADSYTDLWDGDIDNPISGLTETGGAPPLGDSFNFQDFASVWTGGTADGTGRNGSELGTTTNIDFGLANHVTNTQWMRRGSAGESDLNALFALSDLLTIPGANTATAPEPSTFVLAAFGLMGLVGSRRRRNRK